MTTKVTSRVLENTTVTPGTYGNATQTSTITVDAQGRITSAANTSITSAPALNTGNWTIFESGGNLESAGSVGGTTAGGAGGASGSAGAAISGNSNITYLATGTILGAVS